MHPAAIHLSVLESTVLMLAEVSLSSRGIGAPSAARRARSRCGRQGAD
jgi:hypothetical protein